MTILRRIYAQGRLPGYLFGFEAPYRRRRIRLWIVFAVGERAHYLVRLLAQLHQAGAWPARLRRIRPIAARQGGSSHPRSTARRNARIRWVRDLHGDGRAPGLRPPHALPGTRERHRRRAACRAHGLPGRDAAHTRPARPLCRRSGGFDRRQLHSRRSRLRSHP